MASIQESVSMAVFCDFENVALGVRDAKFEKFDIRPVLERLLLKGSIVVKKAYCDWDRYKGFKSTMHEASFELIEIPHIRQSGKNSADIRLVVDALDLCYTKSHVDTFVIVSGDSDFSPLVSKLRENAKKVIGIGVKNSTSDLLVANCDEFIFYDDLIREQQPAGTRRDARDANVAPKRSTDDDKQRKREQDERKAQAIAIAVETFDALASERGESGKIWASVLKSAIKRRKPDFNESYYGFRAFGNLLEEAQSRGLLEVGRDEKSGAFVYRPDPAAATDAPRQPAAPSTAAHASPVGKGEHGKNGRQGRQPANKRTRTAPPVAAEADPSVPEPVAEAVPSVPEPLPAVTGSTALGDEPAPIGGETAQPAHTDLASDGVQAEIHESQAVPRAPARRARKTAKRAADADTRRGEPQNASAANQANEADTTKPPRKSATRSRRVRKSADVSDPG
jgi:uncharacterized protein (TIGR00288 family)